MPFLPLPLQPSPFSTNLIQRRLFPFPLVDVFVLDGRTVSLYICVSTFGLLRCIFVFRFPFLFPDLDLLNGARRAWRVMCLHRSGIVVLVGLMLGIPLAEGIGQEVQLPINIRVQKVTVETGSLYRFYLPDGEFHGRVEKTFKYVTTHAEADYDFLTGDIGFGIGHVLPKVPLKPGVSFRDHLLFVHWMRRPGSGTASRGWWCTWKRGFERI